MWMICQQDLLGFGDADAANMVSAFREICAVPFDDAVVFDSKGVEIDRVREELEYGGLRIKTNATMDGARVRVVVDIGFGDATEPGLTEMDLRSYSTFQHPTYAHTHAKRLSPRSFRRW